MAFPFDAISWLMRARYRLSGILLSDGESGELQCDSTGALKVAVASSGGELTFTDGEILRVGVESGAASIENVGDLEQVTWDGTASSKARLRGWAASFSGITNANTFDIKLDGAAGITVTPAGTEASAADMVTTINGTGGLSGVAFVVNGVLELRGTTSIEVVNVGSDTFAKIGLPNAKREHSLALTSIDAPVALFGDEVEVASDVVDVPAGASVMSLFVELNSKGSDTGGVDISLGYITSAWNDPPTSLLDLVAPGLAEGSVAVPSVNQPFGRQNYRSERIRFAGAVASKRVRRVVVVQVPPHVTGVRVVVNAAAIEGSSDPPRNPPTVSAYVGFGVR